MENPDDLLTIKDEEITVPRVLNEEERAAAAEQEREAEERRKLAELDNPRERGLVDMMDGKLEGKGLEEIWQDLPEPAFMTQTLSDTWTDAQKFTAEKFEFALLNVAYPRPSHYVTLPGIVPNWPSEKTCERSDGKHS